MSNNKRNPTVNKIWNDAERNFIRNNAAIMKDKDLAEKLTESTGRTVTIQAVRKQRQKMGIVKAHGRGICSLAKKDTTPTESDAIARGVRSPL